MSHIVRRPYTQADKQHLIEWLATNHPEEKGRMGNAVWKALCDDQNASPWNDNHSWQSWREQYKQNDKYYINAINKELNKRKVSENTTFELSSGSEDDGERRPKARQPAAKNKQQRPYQRATRLILSENSDDGEEEQSHKSRQVTPPDPSNASKIRLLAKYYAEQSIAESIRSRADTIQDLTHYEDCQPWAKELRPIQWKEFYIANKKAIDEQVAALEQLGNKNHVQKRTLKRQAPSDEEATSYIASKKVENTRPRRSLKRRRVEVPVEDGPDENDYGNVDHDVPDKPPSIEVERGPPTSEAPSSTTATPPRKAAKRSRAVYATPASVIDDDGDEEDDIPSNLELPMANFDRYGVPGSPSGTLIPGSQFQLTPASRPVTPMISQVNASSRANSRGPAIHSFPRSYPSSRPPLLGRDGTPRITEVSYEGSQATATPVVPDPNAGVPETPLPLPQSESLTAKMKGIVGKIFPTTLPSLTPLLREKRATASSTQTAPEESTPPQGRVQPEKDVSSYDQTNYFDAQPSPMPYVGSDSRSTRSYSAEDSVHRTANIRGVEAQRNKSVVEEEEVDELIDDDLENELPPPHPRLIPSRNLGRRPSESPMFVSADSTPSEAPTRANMAAASQHYPLHETTTAIGLVRHRRCRPSQGRFMEDSESEDDAGISQAQDVHFAPFEDEDKENWPQEPSVDPTGRRAAPRLSNVSVRYEDLGASFNQDTPEMPSPKKSLTLIGVTPPEPHITATSVRTDIRATEGATRRIPGGYYTEKPMSKLATRRDEGYSFQPRISLTSPDFGNDSDPDANDDPSPLSLRALRRDGVAAKTKVHFERMATNRDRRKTTGGIGIRFGETSSSMHQTNFAPPPALRSPEKPPLDSDPIQIDSEEEDPPEDDSPLARYSQASRMATSSPFKSLSKNVPRSTTGRISFGGRTSPPAPVPVPIVMHSTDLSSRKPVMAKPGRGTAAGRLGVQNMTEAMWSPVKFPPMRASFMPPPAETSRSGRERSHGPIAGPSNSGSTPTGMTLDYRDQRKTAKWLQSTRGRPLIVSEQSTEKRRHSLPLAALGDVVYSSDSPRRVASHSRSRSTSHRSKISKRSEIEVDEENVDDLSKADSMRVVKYMLSSGLIEPDTPLEASVIFDGLAAYLIHLARDFNFQPQIAREIWKVCWDLEETEQHLARMFGAARATGERGLDTDPSGVGNEELLELQERRERRERIVRESLGASRTRRVSDRLEKIELRPDDDEDSEDDPDSEQSQPPPSVPFEVLHPLLG